MRVTAKAMYDQILRDVTGRLSELASAQRQVATGQRHSALSDDPLAGAQTLRADQGLRAVAQYRRGVTSVRTRLDTEEAVLGQVTDLLTRARELAVSQAGSNANSQTRAVTAAEVEQLLAQAVALGNSRVGGEFTFGGTATTTPPFQPDGTYIGSGAARSAEIGAGDVVQMSHNGQELLVDSGVIGSLVALRDSLAANDSNGILTAGTALDQTFDSVQSLLADVGARGGRLDQALAGLDAIDTALLQSRIDSAEIPLEEAAAHLVAVQNALQAAILSGTRILQSNLTEYYR